ncbi:MAG: hypothetical protein ACYCYM_02045 [Saccharofermentanales bacterium]
MKKRVLCLLVTLALVFSTSGLILSPTSAAEDVISIGDLLVTQSDWFSNVEGSVKSDKIIIVSNGAVGNWVGNTNAKLGNKLLEFNLKGTFKTQFTMSFRMLDPSTAFWFQFRQYTIHFAKDYIRIDEYANNQQYLRTENIPFAFTAGTTYKVKAGCITGTDGGATVVAYINDTKVAEWKDTAKPFADGYFQFFTYLNDDTYEISPVGGMPAGSSSVSSSKSSSVTSNASSSASSSSQASIASSTEETSQESTISVDSVISDVSSSEQESSDVSVSSSSTDTATSEPTDEPSDKTKLIIAIIIVGALILAGATFAFIKFKK